MLKNSIFFSLLLCLFFTICRGVRLILTILVELVILTKLSNSTSTCIATAVVQQSQNNWPQVFTRKYPRCSGTNQKYPQKSPEHLSFYLNSNNRSCPSTWNNLLQTLKFRIKIKGTNLDFIYIHIRIYFCYGNVT